MLLKSRTGARPWQRPDDPAFAGHWPRRAKHGAFAALAALPWPPRLARGACRCSPFMLLTLPCAVRLLVEQQGSSPPMLDLVGPAPMTTDELTALVRRWLGLAPARQLPVPEWILRACVPLAGFLSFDALSEDSLLMLKRGNVAPIAPLISALNWTPREIEAALASEPSNEAALWHAPLFFLRPALRMGLALLWIVTATLSAFVFPLEKSIGLVAGPGRFRLASKRSCLWRRRGRRHPRPGALVEYQTGLLAFCS